MKEYRWPMESLLTVKYDFGGLITFLFDSPTSLFCSWWGPLCVVSETVAPQSKLWKGLVSLPGKPGHNTGGRHDSVLTWRVPWESGIKCTFFVLWNQLCSADKPCQCNPDVWVQGRMSETPYFMIYTFTAIWHQHVSQTPTWKDFCVSSIVIYRQC